MASSFLEDILYSGAWPGFCSSSRWILWSYFQFGGRVSKSFFEKTSRKLWYSWGITLVGSVLVLASFSAWYYISLIDTANTWALFKRQAAW